jgi:hypothetical protein
MVDVFNGSTIFYGIVFSVCILSKSLYIRY